MRNVPIMIMTDLTHIHQFRAPLRSPQMIRLGMREYVVIGTEYVFFRTGTTLRVRNHSLVESTSGIQHARGSVRLFASGRAGCRSDMDRMPPRRRETIMTTEYSVLHSGCCNPSVLSLHTKKNDWMIE